jgi:hypothetical protein
MPPILSVYDWYRLFMSISYAVYLKTRIICFQELLAGERLETLKLECIRACAATGLQAAARGFIDRLRLRRSLSEAAKNQHRQLENWSVILLQKVARGYIARKTLLRSLCIRKQLSPALLRLAEKYFVRGDIWGFLKDLDEELRRSQRAAEETEQREENGAVRFVREVVAQRQADFDRSWDRFPNLISALRHENNILAPIASEDTRITSANAKKAARISTTATNQVPGPLLRRALSSTVRIEVDKEVQGLLNGQLRTRKLCKEMQSVYSSSSKASSVSRKASPSKRRRPITSVTTSNNFIGSTVTTGISNMAVCRADWLSQSVSSENTNTADNLLEEIPLGLEDSLERLLHAAALRCYTPDFFRAQSSNPNEAYRLYLQLPSGLARMRYEQECKRWSQGVINQLRIQGLVSIAQLVPVSKLVACLKNVQAPLSLVKKCADLLVDLKNMRNAPLGLHSGGLAEPVLSTPSEMEKKKTRKKDQKDKGKSPVPIMPARLNETEGLEKGSRLLQSLIEQIDSSSLQTSVEEVFVHAAFLILPFTEDSTSIDKNSSDREEMGQHAFQHFAAALTDPCKTDEEREDMVRRRFRAAVMLTTPFTLKLKDEGVVSVEQLLSLDLRPLHMPVALSTQLEIFCNNLSHRLVQSRILPVLRDHGARKNPGEYMVPMFYDTRYQRTPFDPYGKAPFPSKQVLLRPSQSKDSIDQDLDQSRSLWDKEAQSGTEKEEREKLPGTASPSSWTLFNDILTTALQNSAIRPTSDKLQPLQMRKMDKRSQKTYDQAATDWTDDVFRQTFICPHLHCGQMFSRAYSLKVHLKSHENFPRYHEYKRLPQLGLDEM